LRLSGTVIWSGASKRPPLTSIRLPEPQIDCAPVEALEPGVAVPIGEEEEQALDLDAAAVGEQRPEAGGAECAEALHQNVHLMKTFLLGELIHPFEDGAFRS
jgi:hypothetical protein